MARSKETYSKKEREKKRQKKRKDKAEKKEQRKQEIAEGRIVEPEFMYVDEDGNLTPEPPDPLKKRKFNKEEIMISVPKQEDKGEMDPNRVGTVKFFNDDKGYGFIIDSETKESIFVHAAGLLEQISEGNKVAFVVERGMKGLNAVKVKLVK